MMPRPSAIANSVTKFQNKTHKINKPNNYMLKFLSNFNYVRRIRRINVLWHIVNMSYSTYLHNTLVFHNTKRIFPALGHLFSIKLLFHNKLLSFEQAIFEGPIYKCHFCMNKYRKWVSFNHLSSNLSSHQTWKPNTFIKK